MHIATNIVFLFLPDTCAHTTHPGRSSAWISLWYFLYFPILPRPNAVNPAKPGAAARGGEEISSGEAEADVRARAGAAAAAALAREAAFPQHGQVLLPLPQRPAAPQAVGRGEVGNPL